MTSRLAGSKDFYEFTYLGLENDVVIFAGLGAPTNGTSGTGAGIAGPGSLYTDRTTTTAKVYINTNTKASPTWVSVGSQT